MGFFSNLKDAIFIDDEDDDDDELYEKEMKELEKKESKKAQTKTKPSSVKPSQAYVKLEDDEIEYMSPGKAAQERRKQQAASASSQPKSYDSRPISPPRSPESSYVPRISRNVKRTQDASEIEIYKAKTFSDAQVVCDSLASGVAIIVSFDELNTEDSQRIMDFICGTIYVLQGNIHTISDKIYLFSPNDVEVSGDYMSMVQKSGFGVPTFNKMI